MNALRIVRRGSGQVKKNRFRAGNRRVGGGRTRAARCYDPAP